MSQPFRHWILVWLVVHLFAEPVLGVAHYTWTDGPPVQETSCGRFAWLTWLFSRPPPLLPATLQNQGLEIVGQVQEGGMGRIFHAKGVDREGKRIDVILKEPAPHADLDLFNDEFTILRHLNPGRARMITTEDGKRYIVMDMVLARPRAGSEEPVPAPTMADLIELGTGPIAAFGGRRPSKQEIENAVLAEMQRIHAAGIVHADIKPENILISLRADGTWNATIIDFGLSSGPEVTPAPPANHIRGTLAYMSREAMRNQWTHVRDVRALQVSLLETHLGSRLGNSSDLVFSRQPGIMAGLSWYVPRHVFDDHPSILPGVAMVLQSHIPQDMASLQSMLQEARRPTFLASYVQRWQRAFSERNDPQSREELALEILLAPNLGPQIFRQLSPEAQQFIRARGNAYSRPGNTEGHPLFGYHSEMRPTVARTMSQLP